MFRDSVGQQLNEGDVVVVPFNGSFIDAVVLKLDNGLASNLAVQDGKVPPAAPEVILQIVIRRPVVTPDGKIMDTVKIGRLNSAPPPAEGTAESTAAPAASSLVSG